MTLASVTEHLLAANVLDQHHLYDNLGPLSQRRVDYEDLFFQSSYHTP